MKSKWGYLRSSLAVVAGGVLTACGGGGGGTADTPAASMLSGVAAYGAPLAGASISVYDSNGKIATATAGTNGSYTANISGFVAPILISATGNSGNSVRKYVALLDTSPTAGTTLTANITPLTHALATLASSDGLSPEEFARDINLLKNLDRAKLAQALTNMQGVLANAFADVGLPTNFDPTKTKFSADRTSGGDVLLDTIKVSQSSDGVTLTNVRIPIASGDSGSTATATLTGSTATPPTALPAPTIAAADIKALDAWLAEVNDCLALAPSARVSKTVMGSTTTYTSFLGACATVSGFSAGYKSSGYNLLQTWGPRLDYIPSGATLAPPEILNFSKNAAGDDTAAVRLNYSAPSGGGSYLETARKIGGAWAIDGNQRNYDVGATLALIRSIDASTNGYSFGTIPGYVDSTKNVGKFSAYRSSIFFSFNQTGPNATDVYAVRIKGPGLPTAGLVFAKSSICGTSSSLSLFSNNGSLPTSPSQTAMPVTTATGTSWTFDVKSIGSGYTGNDFYNQYRGISTLTGLPSTSTTNSIASPAVSVKDIPEFPKYDWEVFTVLGGATAADMFSTRLVAKPLAPALGDKQPWAELTADALEYANPAATAKAGDLTDGTASWTVPAGGPRVTSAFIIGSGSTSTVRMGMDRNVAVFGATAQYLSAVAEKNGIGAMCAQTTLPAFTANLGSRTVGTRQTTDKSIQLQQYVFHSGRP